MALLNSMQSLGSVLVIGGCGAFGHNIVDELFDGYDCRISVLDIDTSHNRRTMADGIQYFNGDITSINSILPVFQKMKPNVVIHAAFLAEGSKEGLRKVNVEGTRTVIEASQKTGVTALVHTSSARTIDPASSTINEFSVTKAEAESLVLAASRSPTLLTMSLRPTGIIGKDEDNIDESDVETTSPILFAHAHCLAACALITTSKLPTVPLDDGCPDGQAFKVTNICPVQTRTWSYAKAV